MRFEYILFDLDGTLTDSGIGVTNSVRYALDKFGIEVKDRSELFKFIGPPLKYSFGNFCGFSAEQINRAIEYYHEYYEDKGIFENKVYEGLEEQLKALKDDGRTLIVATSKPEVFAKKILEHFNISQYFADICGCNMDETRVNKGEVIQYDLESCGITDLSKTVMIGDRKYDVIGAKEAGIKSIGVLYGFGSRDELEQAGADIIIETVADIGKVLL